MSEIAALDRQRKQDREYLAACKAHGIEPELPRYVTALPSVSDEAIDAAMHDGAKNGGTYRTRTDDPEPLDAMTPEAVAAEKVLALILPVKTDIKTFVATAGRRALVLAWLLGKRPEPLAEMARQIGVTRASLSTYARRIEDRSGLHGRGQKGASTRETYRRNAKRSWKLRKLNALMADASTA